MIIPQLINGEKMVSILYSVLLKLNCGKITMVSFISLKVSE